MIVMIFLSTWVFHSSEKEQSHGRGSHSEEQVQEEDRESEESRPEETGMDDYSFKFPGLVLSLVVLKSMVMMMEVRSSLPPSFTPWLVFFSFRSLLPPKRKRETAVGRHECVFIIKNRKRNSGHSSPVRSLLVNERLPGRVSKVTITMLCVYLLSCYRWDGILVILTEIPTKNPCLVSCSCVLLSALHSFNSSCL